MVKDDLISRQAVLAALSSRLSIVDMIRVAEIVENVPAVDAEPVVHAHWERVIPTKSAAKWSTKVSCSNCHREGYTRYPRCPNCGAYMSEK